MPDLAPVYVKRDVKLSLSEYREKVLAGQRLWL